MSYQLLLNLSSLWKAPSTLYILPLLPSRSSGCLVCAFSLQHSRSISPLQVFALNLPIRRKTREMEHAWRGAESELLRIGRRTGAAALFVLSGGGAAAGCAAEGDFVLRTVTRAGTPLAMLVCAVGEHGWILAADAAVVRVGPRKFAFAFPGFVYALSLPDGCFDHDVARFELVLERFSRYCNYAGKRDSDFCTHRRGSDFWVSAYSKIATLCGAPSPPAPAATAAALPAARQFSAATKIVVQVFKNVVRPEEYIAMGGASSRPVPAFVFPLLSGLCDVVELLRSSAAPADDERPPGSWQFNAAGLARIRHTVAAMAEIIRAGSDCAAGGDLLAELA
ncbi:uncharacterized protein LOC144704869 [Wolffia australiana]